MLGASAKIPYIVEKRSVSDEGYTVVASSSLRLQHNFFAYSFTPSHNAIRNLSTFGRPLEPHTVKEIAPCKVVKIKSVFVKILRRKT